MSVYLRELKKSDLELLLAWAHISEIWEYLPTSRRGEKLTWEKHFQWWTNRQNRIDWMIIYDGRSVGVVHVCNLDTDYPEIGLYIGEVTLWGKGIGKKALELALKKFDESDV